MKVVCQYCGAVILEDHKPNALVSHGVCSACLKAKLKSLFRRKKK